MKLGEKASGLTAAQPKQNPHRSNSLNTILRDVVKKYPVLEGAAWEIGPGQRHGEGDGPIEFYHPQESRSPRPGKAYIEVRDPNIKGEALKRMIFGDMLHMAPDIDPTFRKARDIFRQTVTPEQLAVDRRAYQRAVEERGETRPFEDWFEISRLDAYLRGFLAPDERDEWRDAYTPQQKKLLGALQRHLKKGK